MDEHQIACAANLREECLQRSQHLTTCTDPDTCTGCKPKPAVHGYLCRWHYEQIERAGATYDRLHALAATLGVDSRALQASSSASTIAGPRVPLSSLQLDLDALDRLDAGEIRDEQGAVIALHWAKRVFAAAARHPTEPRKERLHRLRCPQCRRLTGVVHPPEFAGGKQLIECAASDCSWSSTDPDFTEAVAHMEVRVDSRTRKWLTAQAGHRIQGEDRAGLARVVDALR